MNNIITVIILINNGKAAVGINVEVLADQTEQK